MLKLTRHLYSWTGDPRYFDYYERTLLNHRLGTIQPEDRPHAVLPLAHAGRLEDLQHRRQFLLVLHRHAASKSTPSSTTASTGTTTEGVFVNLFIPSELNWPEKGFRLRQDTTFPRTAGHHLDRHRREARQPRDPAAHSGVAETRVTVKINGSAAGRNADSRQLSHAEPRLEGRRQGGDGDCRCICTSKPCRTIRRLQAFLYGPLVLAGDLGTEGLTDQLTVGPSGPRPERIPLEVPTFQASAANPASWIKPAAAPLTFRTTGQQKDVTLAPLNTIFDKRYSVYWQVS